MAQVRVRKILLFAISSIPRMADESKEDIAYE